MQPLAPGRMFLPRLSRRRFVQGMAGGALLLSTLRDFSWGVAADAPADDKTRLREAGHTLIAKKKRQAS